MYAISSYIGRRYNAIRLQNETIMKSAIYLCVAYLYGALEIARVIALIGIQLENIANYSAALSFVIYSSNESW